MTWRRITVPIDVFATLMSPLQDSCARDIEQAATKGSSDPGIALFCSPPMSSEKAYYFGPGCGRWADEAVKKFRGLPCAAPMRGEADLLVGDERSFSLLKFRIAENS